MTIRKVERDGKSRWVIDIPYKTASGERERFRHDAQVQTKGGAAAEHRRLLVELAQTGTLRQAGDATEGEPEVYTFEDAVRHFRATHLKNGLKPSTRAGYENRIDVLLVPRFGSMPLDQIDGNALTKLDVELVADQLAPSTRAKIQTVLRSVLRASVRAGMLQVMPTLPALPKVGRKVPRPMRRMDLETILTAANAEGRLAFELAGFVGLRASEVRGLRWSDVDLKVGIITVRRGLTLGVEVTPKSHHQRVIPIGQRMRTTLEAAAPKKANPWAPVAITARGKPWGEFGLNQAFTRAMERAKLDGWSFHDLRHYPAHRIIPRWRSLSRQRRGPAEWTNALGDLDAG
ncbi:MAG TPA: tyrosine-type recombinase/integrase [Polyangiaceae bacterium]|nr:tyrosine-type recombinase/integrase [Polyangiaceae bacterium]